MIINWFPGHMAKTREEIIQNLKIVDAVIEMRDARIIKSSSNPEIDNLCKDKPRIILLNKADLAEKYITSKWIEKLSTSNIKVLEFSCTNGTGVNQIKPLLNVLLKKKLDKQKSKGILKPTIRAMVVGIPNVGKSTFINKISRSKKAKTGNKPGVTKSKQWIKTNLGIELLDTPGVLWPKFEDKEVGLNLAFTGAIKDEILDMEELAIELIKRLRKKYPDNLIKRYNLDSILKDDLKNLEKIALIRGTVSSNSIIDYNRVSNLVINDFRNGKLGNISLEEP